MNKKLVVILIVIFMVFMLSAPLSAKKLKKKDFDSLEGKARTFYLTELAFAYKTKDYKYTLDTELGEVLTNLDTKLADAIDLQKLKETAEEKFGIKLNTFAFEMKLGDRENNRIFKEKPVQSKDFTYHRWAVPSTNNRLSITIYVFKLGEQVRLDKVQIEFIFFKLNDDKTVYDPMTPYISNRISWKKTVEIFNIVEENCLIK